jgi:hypothetical protein
MHAGPAEPPKSTGARAGTRWLIAPNSARVRFDRSFLRRLLVNSLVFPLYE